jgi:proton-translocating NADH-quinone oxidoreductase chain N
MCLYTLVGIAKRDRRSAEAAMKLFVLGAVASAIMLYGISIVYGVAGGTGFTAIAAACSGLAGGTSTIALCLGVVFVVGGIAFKMSAAPFHLWAPDVYEGAPSTVAAFLSTASKTAAFAAVIRFLVTSLAIHASRWLPMVVALAILSMVVGNLVAVVQTNLKRLLAYSGIAQAGYILVAVAAAHRPDTHGLSAVWMYLFLYGFTNVAGFLVVDAVHQATGSDRIDALRGLHKRSPLLAFAALIVLFSLGGIPPLAGFVGKLYLFAAGWQGGQYALVVVGALTSVIALYYYLMVALQVYIRDPEDDRKMPVPRTLGWAIGFCTAAVIAIGIYPRPWIALGDSAEEAASFAASALVRHAPAQPHSEPFGLVQAP